MIDIGKLDIFKDAYLELLKQKSAEGLNEDILYLSEKESIVESIQQDVNNLNLTIELFFNAKENNDELAIKAALLLISTFLSGIQGVFYQVGEDIDRYNLLPNTGDFPENYIIPHHYNYPVK